MDAKSARDILNIASVSVSVADCSAEDSKGTIESSGSAFECLALFIRVARVARA